MHICLPVLERGADRHEMTRCNLFAPRQFILASTRRRVCCTSLICRLRLVGNGRNICAKFTLRGKQRKMPLLLPHFTKRSSARCRILFPTRHWAQIVGTALAAEQRQPVLAPWRLFFRGGFSFVRGSQGSQALERVSNAAQFGSERLAGIRFANRNVAARARPEPKHKKRDHGGNRNKHFSWHMWDGRQRRHGRASRAGQTNVARDALHSNARGRATSRPPMASERVLFRHRLLSTRLHTISLVVGSIR